MAYRRDGRRAGSPGDARDRRAGLPAALRLCRALRELGSLQRQLAHLPSRAIAARRARHAPICASDTEERSSFTPGPMVEEIATRLRYVPLAPAGLALFTASTKARMFSASFCSPNDALPTEPCTMPAFSTRNS